MSVPEKSEIQAKNPAVFFGKTVHFIILME
jgi:hypothetical protein